MSSAMARSNRLLARDDIADIMVNGADTVYIEVGGKVQRTDIHFRDNAQLLHICQRIVSQVGRRVDEIQSDLRRAPRRWLTRERHCFSLGHRWPEPHDPQVQEGQAHPRSARQIRRHFAGRRRNPADHRARPLQRAHLRRYWLGQDDVAELPDRPTSNRPNA